MATVKMTDIAKAANVSIATVGRVIHNNGYVSEDARRRVEEAVKALGYVPNTMARALKQKKSGIIGSMVVFNQNSLYQKINNSIIESAEKHGYKIITVEGRLDQNDEEDIVNQFIGMQVDGLVITSNTNVSDEIFDKLHSLDIPVVAIERTYDHPFVDNIVVNDRDGTFNATMEFAKNGHKRIALIAAEREHLVELERKRGYFEAIAKAGIEIDTSLVKMMDAYSLKNGYSAMMELIEANNPPTAVMCTADTLAAGAMQALYEKKLRVPEDVSIIGYDNVLAEQLAPPIDSVDLALEEIGDKLVELFERRMADMGCESKSEHLDTRYVSRGTVKKVK